MSSENKTNHSLRATAISRLFVNRVPEKIIMEQSGHLSKEGVRSYERTTAAQQKDVSDSLSDITSSSRVNSSRSDAFAIPRSDTLPVVPQANVPDQHDPWEGLDELFSAVPEPSTSMAKLIRRESEASVGPSFFAA